MDTERKTLSLVSVEETGFDSTLRLRAGVAKSDITTDEKGVKIRDRLYAKALVLDDDTTQVVIIAMDVTAIGSRRISQRILDDVGEEFLPRLRERIAELQKEQAELLKSLRFTALNFKTFLSLYLRYALYPEHPLDNSYRYLQTEKKG